MREKRRTWPRWIRRLAQSLSFVLFVAYVVLVPLRAGAGGTADWLMRLSPLSGLGGCLSSRTLMLAFWPAGILLVAALVFGRYFCGWCCPLGTTIDVADRFIALFRRRHERAADDAGRAFRASPSRHLKYYLLAVCALTSLLGLSLFAYFDPLSIAGRSYVLVLHPYAANLLVKIPGARELVQAAQQVQTVPPFQLRVITALALLVVLALGLLGRRWWCRTLCPLGALYALLGKWSVTARKVSDACIHCGRCAALCRTDCISRDGVHTLAGECILCLDCQAVCPADAIRFIGSKRDQLVRVDLARRGALATVAAAAVTYPLFKIAPSAGRARGGAPIRPPLAGRDPQKFLQKCLRCGQCMRACPTHVIQPAGLRWGLESLWTPVLVPKVGYCRYDCDACGRACPSGAIPRLGLEQKQSAAMGLAYVDRSRCIPWVGWQKSGTDGAEWDQYNCGICEAACPVPGKAIRFLRDRAPGGQELRRPYVRAEACVGCGACEHVCPVARPAAIQVVGGFRQLARREGRMGQSPVAGETGRGRGSPPRG